MSDVCGVVARHAKKLWNKWKICIFVWGRPTYENILLMSELVDMTKYIVISIEKKWYDVFVMFYRWKTQFYFKVCHWVYCIFTIWQKTYYEYQQIYYAEDIVF